MQRVTFSKQQFLLSVKSKGPFTLYVCACVFLTFWYKRKEWVIYPFSVLTHHPHRHNVSILTQTQTHTKTCTHVWMDLNDAILWHLWRWRYVKQTAVRGQKNSFFVCSQFGLTDLFDSRDNWQYIIGWEIYRYILSTFVMFSIKLSTYKTYKAFISEQNSRYIIVK